jgi:hypothetical protein
MESIKSYQNVIADLNEKVEHIPALYETDEMKRHPCVLHYFFLGCDWYIAEWDREQNLFFGYAILNNDLYNSEWGYISLDELLRIPMINLDYHFTPYTVEDALYRKNKAYFAEYAVEDKR